MKPATTENLNGELKARMVARGDKQKVKKEDFSSPTVACESVQLVCTVDAHERRDVGD